MNWIEAYTSLTWKKSTVAKQLFEIFYVRKHFVIEQKFVNKNDQGAYNFFKLK